MRFYELSVAFKYIKPQRKQLSSSIISLISILVISLVVWLIIVFLSVSWGLEKSWVGKLISLTAPIRIVPTEAYYNSYYYQIDSLSLSSSYTPKSIGEKRVSLTEPYNSMEDQELPETFPQPDLNPDGTLKDFIKIAFEEIEKIPGLQPFEYARAFSTLSLEMVRTGKNLGDPSFTTLFKQNVYVLSHEISEENFPSSDKSSGVEPILIPKNIKDSGLLLGDRGFLTYSLPSAENILELKMPVVVTGFYDPGIIPLGGRFILARKEALSLLQTPFSEEMLLESSGIHVHLDNIRDAETIKKRLEEGFKSRGIAPYFKIETYREYDYAKDILLQLQSEKNLFSMLALIILLVACSNIISMLIILVNDKKEEIGILRSMGASSFSIAAIFGITGIILGFSGSLIGIGFAILTLLNLNTLVELVSKVQGYEMFNPLIYGETLPNELSFEALLFVVLATAFLSLLAGFVPACKACFLKPYEILKAE